MCCGVAVYEVKLVKASPEGDNCLNYRGVVTEKIRIYFVSLHILLLLLLLLPFSLFCGFFAILFIAWVYYSKHQMSATTNEREVPFPYNLPHCVTFVEHYASVG